MQSPLAERMRPKKLNDFLGQKHLIGENGVIRNLLEQRILPSIILWGPPGTGKTTLARLLAESLGRDFYTLNAIQSGVKDLREVINKAKNKGLFDKKSAPILFIDEIHRFNKGQQDALLEAVEKGVVTLIGATTQNPSFEVVNALISRSQVYILEKLGEEDLRTLVDKSLSEDALLNKKGITVKEYDALLNWSDGDARKLLNALEVICNQTVGEVEIDNQFVTKSLQNNLVAYDKNGEMHYDIISAFIKSIRGSDPNGAVYWLARMVEGGEDPKFIARRLIISAAEDIGLANPTALVIANNTFSAVSYVGWPESRIILSECAIYLATSPKSNSAYVAINQAQKKVKETGNLSVPLHLRNAINSFMKSQDYGKGYKYSHNYEENFSEQEYLPEDLNEKSFYKTAENAKEKSIKDFLDKRWNGRYDF